MRLHEDYEMIDPDGEPCALYELDTDEAEGLISAFLCEAVMAVGLERPHAMVDDARQSVRDEAN